MSNPNIKPRFTSENQPKNRGRRKGSTPGDWLKKLSRTKIDFMNPFTGKADKGSVASVVAIQLILKATQDGDIYAIKEILDRLDGKVTQKLLNEVIGNVTFMSAVKLDGKPLEIHIGD